MGSVHQEMNRSRTSSLIPLLLGALVIAGVAVALVRWSSTPNYAAPAHHGAAQAHDAGAPRPAGTYEPMPVGDIPGWHQVFADDFKGQGVDLSKWRVYDGQPGGDPAAWFDPRHVQVHDGMLIISGYRDPADGGKWATGGLSTAPGLAQTYGKYLVRFRLDSGVGIGHGLLLWPADNSWPPEVDFSEDNGAGRIATLATVHYGALDRKTQKVLAVNLTQWHTLGVEWTPGQLRFTIDGRVWWNLRSSRVPAIPMVLALQTQTWPCVGTWGRCPNASTPATVRMYVDWVVAYAPAGNR
jgi:beta-glucanase (GH16 family)